MKNPFIVAVSDYHEFKTIQHYFAAADITLKFKEIGWYDMSAYRNGPHDGYHAIFYTSNKSKEAAKMMADFISSHKEEELV